MHRLHVCNDCYLWIILYLDLWHINHIHLIRYRTVDLAFKTSFWIWNIFISENVSVNEWQTGNKKLQIVIQTPINKFKHKMETYPDIYLIQYQWTSGQFMDLRNTLGTNAMWQKAGSGYPPQSQINVLTDSNSWASTEFVTINETRCTLKHHIWLFKWH